MSEEDAVKVCLRVRPLIHREQGEQVNLVWKTDNNSISQVDGTRSFSFDRVFHSHETTCQVYQEVAVPIIRSALQGYNGTIFAYGQTSSGKTYTMMGTPDNLGIIPQAIKEVFKIIHEIPSREFLLRVSYMEIYNETVTDLLCDDRKKKPLEIREDINRNVYVADLTEELVMEHEHVLQWIKKGEKNRHYGETKMNDHSSRSHAIFRMILESRERNDPGNQENCEGAVMVSHLNLVDLAGSERASQTGAEGVRFKEGCNINRSLFILGQVIKKLSDGQVGGFINYRDSKLTRILQNSLGGNTKTVIICTITPVSLDETLSTLQFASTAKHVRNTPHVNEVLDDQALLKRYRKEILDLKKQLEELEASSEIKTHAVAKEEEHSHLLAEIKQLRKEREERIWNLTNIVVASSQPSHEDQRVNRKRRVTWAPGKLQNSLHASVISPFEIGSTLTSNLAKRPKVTDFSTIQEIDDSVCTEFSDFDDVSRVLDDFSQDADWNFGSKVTRREKTTTALSLSMIDFSSDSSSALKKDSSLQKCKELELKVAELQNQLTKLSKEYEVESRKRQSLEKETSELQQQQLQSKERDELVQTLELEITSLKDQLRNGHQCSTPTPLPGDNVDMCEGLTALKTDEEQGPQLEGACQEPAQEQLSSHIHDLCREQIQMLELKIADLEENSNPQNNEQTYLMESVQICEALLAEKQSASDEFAIMQSNLDHLVAENESLKTEIADLKKCLQEKHETNEFESLEKEIQKEHEAQLTHEISSLKKLIENAEVYNQELENDLENKSILLKEQEKQMAELKKESEILQKKVSYSDLCSSLGDGEKLCEEVFQMRQSLSDAETVTRDAQKEAAFLRSENLELKDKLDELSIRCEKREKDASDCEKQLEIEKSNYKRMQADLQKELQYTFNEINQLNGLLVGKVPKDLLSRVELDKQVADYSKQLASLLEEKKALEQEVESLLEYKSLPSEVEHLKDQLSAALEEKDKLLQAKQELETRVKELEGLLESSCMENDNLQGAVNNLSCEVTTLKQQMEKQSELCKENQELEEKYRALFSEKEHLQEQLRVSSLTVMQPENAEASSKLEELQEVLKLTVQLRDELLVKVEDLEAEKNSLRLDLNENIELSIETQDELRITLEELKQQKQLVTDLQKQLADCAGDVSSQADDQGNVLEEKLSTITEKLQENEAKYETLTNEKTELERVHQSLISEMKLLQERMQSAEMSLSKVEEENNELKQKLEEQLKSGDVDELMNSSTNLQESGVLEKALNRQLQQENDEKGLQLQEQMLALLQDKDVLHETLKNLTAERDQLKLDLQENIEMSIDTQEELRCALDEVKVKTELLESLSTQVNEIKVGENEDLNSLCQHLKQDSEKYLAQLDVEKSSRTELQCEVEEKRKRIEELETKLEHILRNLEETESKYNKMAENLELVTKEKDHLISSLMVTNGNLLNEMTSYKQDNQTKDQSLQGSDEISTNVDQFDTAARQEEIEMERDELTEILSQLQQRVQLLSQEKVELQQTIDNLKKERGELLTDLQRHTENYTRSQEEIQRCQDELKQQISFVGNFNSQVTNSTFIDEKGTETDLMPSLEVEVLGLQEKLLQKNNEYQQLIQNIEKLGQDKSILSTQVEGLLWDMTEKQSTLQSLQNEKLDAERKLLDLGQQMEVIVQERDHLKCAQQVYSSKIDQESQTKDNDQASHFEKELEQSNLTINNDLELLKMNLKNCEEELEMLKSEKYYNEQKINNLQNQVELATEELKNMKVARQCLESEMVQLKEELEKNIEKYTETRDELKRTQEELEQQKQRVEKLASDNSLLEDKSSSLQRELEEKNHILNKALEGRQITDLPKDLTSEMEHVMEALKTKELELKQAQEDKEAASWKILELTNRVQSITQERDDLQHSKENLQEECIEPEDELKRTREELEQQKQRVEKLTNNIYVLEEKSSSLERELEEKNHILNKALEDGQITDLPKDLTSEMEQVMEALKTKELELKQAQEEKAASCKILELANKVKTIAQERDDLQDSKANLEKECTETRDELKKTQEELEQQKQRVEKLDSDISLLEEKSSSLEREMEEKNDILNKALEDGQITDLPKDLASEMEQVMEVLKNKELELKQAQEEKEAASQKILEISNRVQSITQERDDLQHSKENLEEECTETQDELKRTQEELEQQKQMVEKLANDISLLEEKSSSLERELEEKNHTLNKALEDRQITDQSKQDLASEVEQVMEVLKNKELELKQAQEEKEAASQKMLELSSKVQSITQNRDDLQHSTENLEEKCTETRDELKKTREELEQQKQRVEKLESDISLLEDKSSSLERELEEKVHILNKSLEDRQVFDQSKQDLTSELEQVLEALKNKELDLKQAEKEKEAASQKILELSNKIQSITQERDDLQHSKETLEKEARTLRDDIQQLQHEYAILANGQSLKSSQLDELETGIQQLQEKLHLNEASTKQLEDDKVALQKQSQQYELEVTSLRQEQEQFQQLLQRARSEKENIYASLRDQEKALQEELRSLQTELEAVKMERDENKAHLVEKVNEANEMLQKISSLEEQKQQELTDEKMKYFKLCEKVDLQEKEITVLRLVQSEPTQEDELAERTEVAERKTQEWQDLMVNISTVYSNHHSLLTNLSSDLQSETEAQKQSMGVIKESLSSTLSKAFGNLETEHTKLNSQMQTLLNRFKIVYRNAVVKKEHSSVVQNYETELRAVQKKNDELLLRCQSLEQRGTKWCKCAAEDLKFCELEFLSQLITNKIEAMKQVEDCFSEVQVTLKSIETDLQEEMKCKQEFTVWLEDFKGLHLDTEKLRDGVLQENRRLAGAIQYLTKKLKAIAQSKTKQGTMMYLNSLETDLHEKKGKHKELLQRMQQIAPCGDSSILEEENSQMRETLKNVQGELKKMQCRIRGLENELSSAKAEINQKEQNALLLKEKLRSSTAEGELSEMKVKMDEKQKRFETALKEIQTLQEKVSKGAAPYKEEIDCLKNQVVRVEMERMKLSKASDQQIASLKSSIEDKEASLRKLREQLRRTQKDIDTTVCSENTSSSSQYPLTCGGGSGIVQSTAMLILQSENAALKREIAQYKKKLHQLSRNISSREDELKKLKAGSSETSTTLFSSLHQDDMFHSSTDPYRGRSVSPRKSEMPTSHTASPGKTGIHRPVSPRKSEMPTSYTASPGKTGLHRKRVLSPSKTEVQRPQPMSPNKMDRHSVPAMSPGNTGLYRKRAVSPFKTEGPLFSTLTSPCKKQNLPEKTADSPKDKFFDAKSRSLPYGPSKFFDNSSLAIGTLADMDLYAGTSAETNDINNWWDRAGKTETPNDCKTS
ncbi:centromere-associated protein E [Bufo gargarizans]|uniref:centromere-associated protein E n=1 Tax=Bufo gargarizans TaxID=30331 RepID=UPI001CF375BF|nr:centromere-associated protein E [Bufo gargarizans]